MATPEKIVCFDIGGVLVRIRHTWDQAIIAANREPRDDHKVPLDFFKGLPTYQAGNTPEEQFIDELSLWLNLPVEDALLVHRSILDSDYPGAELLVRTLQEAGVYTCCFSNTNALHWKYLIDAAYHPAVAALDQKLASHEISAAKPELAAFDKVDKMLPPHQRVIFFDDTAPNVIAAREYGWTSFQIDPKGNPVLQMRETLAKLEILD